MNHPNRSRLTVDPNGKWRLYTLALPPHATVLGTVTRDGFDTGALIRFEVTGEYAQLNAGALRSLERRKIEAALAGNANG